MTSKSKTNSQDQLLSGKKSSRCNSHTALVCLNVLLVAVIVCMAVFFLTANSQSSSSSSSSSKATRDVSSVESQLWAILNGQEFEKLLNERMNEFINGTIMAGPPGTYIIITSSCTEAIKLLYIEEISDGMIESSCTCACVIFIIRIKAVARQFGGYRFFAYKTWTFLCSSIASRLQYWTFCIF